MRPPRWKLPAWRPPSWRWPRWRRPDWRGLRSLPLSMMLASLLAGLGAVQMTFLIGSGLYRSYTWGREGEAVRRELAILKADIRVLRETRSHTDDPEELRAQARCLGFVGEGERLVVAQDAPEGQSNCDAVRMP